MLGLGKIVHLRYRDLGELPAGDFPDWIKRIRSRSIGPKGWRVIDMPWGEVFGPADLGDLKQIAHWTDQLLGMMDRVFRVPFHSKISVFVLPDAEEFDRYCRRCGASPGAYAFYNNETGEIAVSPGKSPTAAGLQRQLAHELTHAYTDLAIGFLGPPWFAEGLAEYFSSFYLRRGVPVPGALLPELVWEAEDHIGQLKLSKVLGYGWEEFYKEKDLLYSVALAFTYYLIARIGLVDLFETVYEGRSSDLLKYGAAFRKELSEYAGPPEPPPGWEEAQLIHRKS